MSPTLAPKDERLIAMVSAVTRGDWPALQQLRKAAPAGEPDLEWREALLQSHLFLGFPRVVEAFEQLAAVGGLGFHGQDPAECDSCSAWQDRGSELFDTIYGDLAQPVRRRLHQHHPDFASWIGQHAYARVLSRPGLAPHRRELLALVCLLHGSLDRQLASHARGAIRLGATPDQVAQVVASQAPYLAPEVFERLQAVAQRFAGEV
ncbi:MAG: carboxymuconolactone decarboxylase family protein [Planctomycetes bacterium]|nr:carboxymuconolactone decarboxylase family protein [Planctomycetota bacterium]MCB9910885.1 carboxymuconolactone decarboxylase family protein [Planctomycetota bacterium]MCB9912096.1 carboxymuconolactone decarboxylase family protein [Planctomycetota bacterium]